MQASFPDKGLRTGPDERGAGPARPSPVPPSGDLGSRQLGACPATNAGGGALEVARGNRAGTALSDYVDIPGGTHRGRRIARTLDDREIGNQTLPNNSRKARMDLDAKYEQVQLACVPCGMMKQHLC
jgi:hypothetical protein